MGSGLSIGRAARQAGVGIETIRFYERQSLVRQPPKPDGAGVRRYPADMIERIRFIKEAQELGFSLREIHDLLALRADPAADCAKVQEQATAKLGEVRRKIGRLQDIGAALERLIAACPGRGGLQACSIIDALTHRPSGRPEAQGDDGGPSRSHPSTGKERRMKNTVFKVEGLHCGGCAATVKALVEKEPGVKAVSVSFKDGEARVLYDPEAVTEDRLTATIQKPGYRVVERR